VTLSLTCLTSNSRLYVRRAYYSVQPILGWPLSCIPTFSASAAGAAGAAVRYMPNAIAQSAKDSDCP
jgi:hypothetical protein